ncbi:MAG: DUF998 domain-containing protein [Conexivisphaerales archaeon]
MNVERVKTILLFMGPVAIASAVIWIGAAIAINPTFDFFSGALSQLGSPGANAPWVYNTGLIFTSILLFLFSVSLLLNSKNKIESSGSSFLMITSLFLALIGIYHGGTYPHDFVSLWFFVLADISIFAWGVGLLFDVFWHGVYVLILVCSATILGFGISWQSSAELETFGTAAISVWAVLMFIFYFKSSKLQK